MSLDGWKPVNSANLAVNRLDTPLSDALPVSVTVTPGDGGNATKTAAAGLQNVGYWGMDVRVQNYTGTFWVYGGYEGVFTADLRSDIDGEVFGSVEVESKAVDGEWVEHTFALVPDVDAPSSNNTFALTFDPAGLQGESLDFNLISLFPPTYKDRKNGLRVDIAEALAELHPVRRDSLRLPALYWLSDMLTLRDIIRPSCASPVATCSRD